MLTNKAKLRCLKPCSPDTPLHKYRIKGYANHYSSKTNLFWGHPIFLMDVRQSLNSTFIIIFIGFSKFEYGRILEFLDLVACVIVIPCINFVDFHHCL